MGALPNTLPKTPQTPRKPAGKSARSSKLNQYGRDPLSVTERHRAQSDYDKQTGYAPLFHSFFADVGRLTSGGSCTLLLFYLWDRSAGRGMQKGKPRPEWTLALAVEELAEICNCDVRTIERELVALEKRGIGEVKRPAKGQIEARLLYRDWEKLPNYKSEVVEMAAPEETVLDPETVDESKPGNQRVTGKSAVRLPAGALSKVYPVSCGVKQFRYKADGPVDLDITAVIQAGELVVTSRLPADWAQKFEFLKPSSNVSNDLTSPPRHGCREDAAKVGRRSVAINHPRAGELMNIFDPLLGKSGAVLLAMDAVSLRAACEAVGDCDHHDLLKFVMNRAERGPIRKPQTVAVICGEALASSRAGKIITGAGLPKSTNRGTPAERAIQAAKEKARCR